MSAYGVSQRNGVSRVDVVAVVGVVAVLGLLLGFSVPQIGHLYPRGMSQTATCQYQLGRLGDGLFACRTEHNDIGPWNDDGHVVYGGCSIMLTWADVLYDFDYVSRGNLQFCPSDARPDPYMRIKGTAWGFEFVDEFGVGETPKPGVRTSYAQNMIIAYGYTGDLYPDASRQIFITDGVWDWMANTTAAWTLAPELLGAELDPMYPNWECSHVAYRHGADHGANMLFMDGSVRRQVVVIPAAQTVTDLLLMGTSDTEAAFTWLPGERDYRMDNDRYRGTHSEWQELHPELWDLGTWWKQPRTPDELNPIWRTQNNAWMKLPNPSERCQRSSGIAAPDEPAAANADALQP